MLSGAEIEEFVRINSAVGGRVGLESGTPKKGLESISIKDLPVIKGPYMIKYDKDGNPVKFPKPKGEPYRYEYDEEGNIKDLPKRVLLRNKSAMGGLQSMPMGQMRMK
jgi:YD repeat-containing protein